MFSHVMVGCSDLERTQRFYDSVLGTLGVKPGFVDRHRIFWRSPGGAFSASLPIYSSQYRPYFAYLPRGRRVTLSYFMGDTTFVMFLQKFPEPVRRPGQLEYFLGMGLLIYGVWQVAVITGIVAGAAIPQEWGLSFAGTMALLALTCGQLRSRSTWLAALAASAAAVAAYALPLRLNIVVAIAVAIGIGALTHRVRSRGTGGAA